MEVVVYITGDAAQAFFLLLVFMQFVETACTVRTYLDFMVFYRCSEQVVNAIAVLAQLFGYPCGIRENRSIP